MPAPKKPMASISIPVRGDKVYREAVNELASQEGYRFTADLIRECLNTCYGDELKVIEASLAAKNVSQKKHTRPSRNI